MDQYGPNRAQPGATDALTTGQRLQISPQHLIHHQWIAGLAKQEEPFRLKCDVNPLHLKQQDPEPHLQGPAQDRSGEDSTRRWTRVYKFDNDGRRQLPDCSRARAQSNQKREGIYVSPKTAE